MKKINDLISKNRSLILFFIFLISILFYYSVTAQGQGRYTVFRTQNKGFKFYRGNLYAPVFGDHPISNLENYHDWWDISTLNQLTTKYYVLSSELAKIILYPESISFESGSTRIGHKYLGGRSWIEERERFQEGEYPASLSFELPTEHPGVIGGFRDLTHLPVPPASFKKIRLQMYVNDSGFCVLSFSQRRVDSRNLTEAPMVKIFIIKDVKPRIFNTNYSYNYYGASNYGYDMLDYYWKPNFFWEDERYWSINGSVIPLDINLEDIIIPANTTVFRIMKHSDGSDVTDYNEYNGDWYMIDVKLRSAESTPFPLANLFKESNFRYAYMEGQARNEKHWGGVACKFTVYTDKYLQ